MDKLNQNPLFDKVAVGYVFGSIMHDPKILTLSGDKYLLNEDDFVGKLNKILFGAIWNLSYKGADKISPIDIDIYLTAYDTQYDLYQKENGPLLEKQWVKELINNGASTIADLFFDYHIPSFKRKGRLETSPVVQR